ncbi:hypothetical protein phiPLPE_71 [Iodobacter phage PhiPLPE]|uniref:Uncharacterized protein n=1 Tax=Iodobacter phage PhiPLPE TaxID=551895 RepID=B5AX90_9CAUD|nr:hypothetical protein phiPLPE_71 [Iodobacter phage PhiPLPE]ACG60393.1 hypothetical protein phiPLPE_71 [Iodobacter phage PhiPLPE]
MSDRLKEATALLDEVHVYIDEWNYPIDLQVRIIEFLEGNQNNDDLAPRPSAIELQDAEIGIPEPFTGLLNPVNQGE